MRQSSFGRFVNETDQLHGGATTRLEHLAVRSEHVAKGHVLDAHRVREPASRPGGGPDHVKVLSLRGTHHVENLMSPEDAHTVPHCGEVRRGVSESFVGLLNDEWKWLTVAVGKARQEDDLGTVGLFEDAGGGEVGDDVIEQGVIEGLSDDVFWREQHIELFVDLLKISNGLANKETPESAGLVVATLEQYDTGPTALLEVFVGVELGARGSIEGVEVAHRESLDRRVFA